MAQGTNTDPNRYTSSPTDLIKHLSGEMVLNYLSLHTIPSEKHLCGTIIFEDDWTFEQGRYLQQATCYYLDYWQGILTYYPVDLNEPTAGEAFYQGKRLAFMNQLLGADPGELQEWHQVFEFNAKRQRFAIIEP
ncbi:hypothetical protein P7H00_01065 [Enterococcus pseudoavium]|uniref:Uncharacterized protein n=1 Tax=Enterococcus pseudoavium TaxID=44007 RepID=A0AAE4I099_9ENTE|nr:hypothetical protein [Enterococcus pseudoavium]MDT2735720.1 hypothetical protein [Enterococcus pseudoavium]